MSIMDTTFISSTETTGPFVQCDNFYQTERAQIAIYEKQVPYF
jgi:hypothetical protein